MAVSVRSANMSMQGLQGRQARQGRALGISLSARQLKRRRQRWRQIAFGAFGGVVFFSLLLTLVQGRYQLGEQRVLEARIEVLERELGILRGERETLARRVRLLRSESLDVDFLDEAALRELGFTLPGDVLIVLPEEESQDYKGGSGRESGKENAP
ncbi:MAG: septum formation initiator family protein [Alphaproteobacteria bacterium]